MSDEARQLLEEALRLPLAERADLAAELLASMDGAPDPDADQAWAVEIERRARRAIRGESQGRDWDAVRSEIEAKLRRK
ncbi:MAG TPA: addiction module protein [Polyangia bacterium]|nr:addiction module protein [Polyangia bacterium]